MKNKQLISALAAAALTLPGVALATNGYFSAGFGPKDDGMAGAGVALPQTAMAAATNPAGMVFVGTRIDLGAAIFNPVRGYENPGPSGSFPMGAAGSDPNAKVYSDKNYFLIPHFAANYMLNSRNSVGVAVYGNGGMNTTYHADSTYSSLGTYNKGNAGVDMMQLFVNLNAAHRFGARTAVGGSMLLVEQRFAARGLAQFSPFSSDKNYLTNKGYDFGYGVGWKFGVQTDVTHNLTVGASYQTRVDMSKFDKYRGLFAQHGGFDIPPTATIGLAWKVTPRSTIVFDVQKIWYSQIASVGNPMYNSVGGLNKLGSDNGAGFGWKDVTAYKLGYQWQSGPNWTWRVGYSHNNNPIPSADVLFNVIAPAVIKQHFTFGFTRKMPHNNELTVSAMYTGEARMSGDGGAFGNPDTKLFMHELKLEASWGWKFN